MPNIFTTGIFKSPKYSSFHSRPTNKLSARIGRLLPVKQWFLGAGDRVVSDMAHLIRFSPLLAPVMDSYESTFDVHFVPCRLLDPVASTRENHFERFFNLYENVDGRYALDKVSARKLFAQVLLRCADVSDGVFREPIEQSLYDYLGYPMYDNFVDSFWKYFVQSHMFDSMHVQGDAHPNMFTIDYLPVSTDVLKSFAARATATYFDNDYTTAKGLIPNVNSGTGFSAREFMYPISGLTLGAIPPLCLSFLTYVISMCYAKDPTFASDFPYRDFSAFLGDDAPYIESGLPTTSFQLFFARFLNQLRLLGAVADDNSSYAARATWGSDLPIDWSKVWEYLGVSFDDCYLMWKSAILGRFLFSILDTNSYVVHEDGSPDPDPSLRPTEVYYRLPSERVNLLPLYSYWRAVADWYVNLLVDENDFDADEFYLDRVSNLDVSYVERIDWSPINRSWANDYFTSAFPSPQTGQAVRIPVNGTMQDLRGSNALITIKEKLLYTGKKIKDVLYGIFGIHSSDARLDMTEVVSRNIFPVNIQTITNVSAGGAGTPLASLAGNGVGTGLAPIVDYTAEEPGILFVFASVRPRASYFQGVNRFLLKGDSVYDYVVPDFANVGMQEIRNSELYLDYNTVSAGSTFGFTRRYAEFMYEQSEVHGSMRNSLLYWHSARRFANSPVLGQQFMEVDIERDDLNRIFADQNSENIVLELVFDCHVVRPLPKYVRYNY